MPNGFPVNVCIHFEWILNPVQRPKKCTCRLQASQRHAHLYRHTPAARESGYPSIFSPSSGNNLCYTLSLSHILSLSLSLSHTHTHMYIHTFSQCWDYMCLDPRRLVCKSFCTFAALLQKLFSPKKKEKRK